MDLEQSVREGKISTLPQLLGFYNLPEAKFDIKYAPMIGKAIRATKVAKNNVLWFESFRQECEKMPEWKDTAFQSMAVTSGSIILATDLNNPMIVIGAMMSGKDPINFIHGVFIQGIAQNIFNLEGEDAKAAIKAFA